MAGDFSTSAKLSSEDVFNTFSTGARRRDRQTTIGVGDLGRGVYHFSLTSTEGTVTKKLVVE